MIAAHCFIENTYINLKMENYLIILGSAKRPHSVSDPFIKVSTKNFNSYVGNGKKIIKTLNGCS